MSTETPPRHRSLGRRLGGPLVVSLVAAIVLVPASPAAAHHGWDGFDTDNLIYVAGTVSSDGSWGEPHTYFDATLDTDLPIDTPALTIPEDLQDPEDSIRVESALSYDGPQDELEVIIAPPAYTGRWGLDRPLTVGERFQGVGYINRTDDGLFRPVAFWYGEDEVPVNQVLGSTLPVRAPLPGSAAPSGGTSLPSATSTAADPIEETDSSVETDTSPATDTEATPGNGGYQGVWAILGIVVIAGVVGGFLYLRRRPRQS